jgi:hypothetical protein
MGSNIAHCDTCNTPDESGVAGNVKKPYSMPANTTNRTPMEYGVFIQSMKGNVEKYQL